MHASHIIHSWIGPAAVQTRSHGQVVAPQGPFQFHNFYKVFDQQFFFEILDYSLPEIPAVWPITANGHSVAHDSNFMRTTQNQKGKKHYFHTTLPNGNSDFVMAFLWIDLEFVHLFNGNPAVGHLDSIAVDKPSVYTLNV